MPTKRFTGEQVIRSLREAEGPGGQVRTVGRKYGIAEQTFSRWRREYGRLGVADAVRLRQPQREAARLTKLVAERALELAGLKEAVATQG